MKNICCSWILEIIGTIEWRWGWNGTKWILRAFLKEAGCNLITFHIEMWARIEIQSVNDVKQHFKGSKYERDIWICLTHLGLRDRIRGCVADQEVSLRMQTLNNIHMRSGSNPPEYCMCAPRKESSMDPSRPATPPYMTIGHWGSARWRSLTVSNCVTK